MKKYIIYSDCHFGGVDPVNVKKKYTKNTIFLGDNHEFKNVPKNKVTQLMDDYEYHLKKCTRSGAIEIVGNHEVSVSQGRLFHFDDGVLFIHGHRALYSEMAIAKWETRKPGQGFFLRIFSKSISKLRHCFPKKEISKNQLKKLDKYVNIIQRIVREPVHTVVFGHTHPISTLQTTYFGRRYVNVVRGKSEVWV